MSNLTARDQFEVYPYAIAQFLLRGKWTILVLYHLQDRPVRFNELQRRMPKIDPSALSNLLKRMQTEGLIVRTDYKTTVPHVEYSLTDLGRHFRPVLEAMQVWGLEYIAKMRARTRRSPDHSEQTSH